MSEMFNDHRKQSQVKRANNREKSTQLLDDEGFDFEVKNNGAQIIVQAKDCVFDFWPGTGKFSRRGGYTGRGVFNLVRDIKKTYAP